MRTFAARVTSSNVHALLSWRVGLRIYAKGTQQRCHDQVCQLTGMVPQVHVGHLDRADVLVLVIDRVVAVVSLVTKRRPRPSEPDRPNPTTHAPR